MKLNRFSGLKSEHKLIFKFAILAPLLIFAMGGCSGESESQILGEIISRNNDNPSDVSPVETEALPDEEEQSLKTMAWPLGEVRVTNESSDACKNFYMAGNHEEVEVAVDKCMAVEVTCAGLKDSNRVLLRIGEPNAEINEPKGSIVFLSGNSGKGYWGNSPSSVEILERVRAEGFRTIEVSWQDGWLFGSEENKEGLGKLACRPATLFRWIYNNPDLFDNTSKNQAFCSAGHSGGSMQVTYPLTHYGLDEIFSLVIATGGIYSARIDKGCLNPDSKFFYGGRNDDKHDPNSYGRVIDSSYTAITNNQYTKNGGPCLDMDQSYRKKFKDASVINSNASSRYVYPNTMVSILLGEKDPGIGIPHAYAFYHHLLKQPGAVESLIKLERLIGVGHGVRQKPLGAKRIRKILLKECKPRGNP
jgi:hypothetical protein